MWRFILYNYNILQKFEIIVHFRNKHFYKYLIAKRRNLIENTRKFQKYSDFNSICLMFYTFLIFSYVTAPIKIDIFKFVCYIFHKKFSGLSFDHVKTMCRASTVQPFSKYVNISTKYAHFFMKTGVDSKHLKGSVNKVDVLIFNLFCYLRFEIVLIELFKKEK